MLTLKFTMEWWEEIGGEWVDKYAYDVTVSEMWEVIKNSGMSKEQSLKSQLVISDYCVTDGVGEYHPAMEETFGPWSVMAYAEGLKNWNDLDKFYAVDELYYCDYEKKWKTNYVFYAFEDDFVYEEDEIYGLVAYYKD